MRKYLSLFLLIFLFAACKKITNEVQDQENPLEAQIASRQCAAHEVLEAQMSANPSLRQRMNEIEMFTQRVMKNPGFRTSDGSIEIPVVVHVIWNTLVERVSPAQVQSQIDVLNEDFNLRNKDSRLTPSIFADRKADVGITFKLLKTNYVETRMKSWQITDGMKYTSRGGNDAVDPENILNVWVVDLAGYLGYAQFPGGNPATDGIVVDYFAFGKIGDLYDDYNLGRTATHEVGHWLNLRHIWGDATCGNDGVDDTPFHTKYNFGCPAFPQKNQCASGEIEMTMNYMDYTDDKCMYMFSNGQKDRMKALFSAGGPRYTFAN